MLHRREFLAVTCAAILVPATGRAQAAGFAPGIYPIAWSPCTPDGRLDLAALAGQAGFCEKTGVRGLVWPQNASAWDTLSEEEWQAGVAALLKAPRKLKIVIGVQTPDGNVDHAVERARHAAALGADGIISLPPAGQDVVAYYKAIGAATSLPLMMQAVGDASVEMIEDLARAVPTLCAVKDEAGDPLKRAPRILATKLADFSGGGGRNLLTEMQLGFAGSCPYVGLADYFQQSFDLWHAGKRAAAFDLFGRILAFNSIPGANEYVLTVRGVFGEDVVLRRNKTSAPARPLDAGQKQFIRQSFQDFMARRT
jgi:4-hydroxy-tetrahydrodipicolinate synthase